MERRRTAEPGRHPRTQLDVRQLVRDEARRVGDEIDGRARRASACTVAAVAAAVLCSANAICVQKRRASSSSAGDSASASSFAHGKGSMSGRSRRQARSVAPPSIESSNGSRRISRTSRDCRSRYGPCPRATCRAIACRS